MVSHLFANANSNVDCKIKNIRYSFAGEDTKYNTGEIVYRTSLYDTRTREDNNTLDQIAARLVEETTKELTLGSGWKSLNYIKGNRSFWRS